jgi:hypothetical protein
MEPKAPGYREPSEAFDRTQLIPIDKGEHNFSNLLPEVPNTVERVITAGRPPGLPFPDPQGPLTAEQVIAYLQDLQATMPRKISQPLVKEVSIQIDSLRQYEEKNL